MSNQQTHSCLPDDAETLALDEAYKKVDAWRSVDEKLYRPSGAKIVQRHEVWTLIVGDEYFVAISHCPFCGVKL